MNSQNIILTYLTEVLDVFVQSDLSRSRTQVLNSQYQCIAVRDKMKLLQSGLVVLNSPK